MYANPGHPFAPARVETREGVILHVRTIRGRLYAVRVDSALPKASGPIVRAGRALELSWNDVEAAIENGDEPTGERDELELDVLLAIAWTLLDLAEARRLG